MSESRRIAEDYLDRLQPVINDNNVDICLQAASAFADDKLNEVNVLKAAGAAGLTRMQMKVTVLLLLKLQGLLWKQPSLATVLPPSTLFESIIEWSEAVRGSGVIVELKEDRSKVRGALLRCKGRFDIEVTQKTIATVPANPSILLQLHLGGIHEETVRFFTRFYKNNTKRQLSRHFSSCLAISSFSSQWSLRVCNYLSPAILIHAIKSEQ
ncbi:hypothetical protein PMAYCL1PPCAC_00094 [Pristionchus mayeri]|uniref:Uncharacterized protein n=1 Tax=Pristionchus mayeri TaxID=1317129 RepID=A0AAN5C5P1_9BILA|nr:hypothetical protein PMAYCL1PPCAC_00094 [Pristionchus mayeri]